MGMATERIGGIIEDEIEKIADKGLTNSNIDVAYKLIDMLKDIRTIEGMEEYDSGNSYGMHWVKGHYSRDNDSFNRYSRAKYDYRHSKNSGHDVMNSLDAYMGELTTRLNDMLKDADTNEERETIRNYIAKIQNM